MFGLMKNLIKESPAPVETARLGDLHVGCVVGFGFMPQKNLSGKRIEVAGLNSYLFDTDNFIAYKLASEGVDINLIVADEEDPAGTYLALSQPIDSKQYATLFPDAPPQYWFALSEGETVDVKAPAMGPLQGWLDGRYTLLVSTPGRYLEGDWRIRKPTERGRLSRAFDYVLLVDEENEYALEAENYEDGTLRVYATIYRPATDIGEIKRAPKASAYGSVESIPHMTVSEPLKPALVESKAEPVPEAKPQEPKLEQKKPEAITVVDAPKEVVKPVTEEKKPEPEQAAAATPVMKDKKMGVFLAGPALPPAAPRAAQPIAEVPKSVVVEAPKAAVAEAPKEVAVEPAPEAAKTVADAPKAANVEAANAAVVEAPKVVVAETAQPVADAPKPVIVEAPKAVAAEVPKEVAVELAPEAAQKPKSIVPVVEDHDSDTALANAFKAAFAEIQGGAAQTQPAPELVKAEPTKVEAIQAELAKVEPVKVEMPKAEPLKVESVKAEPVNVEPIKVEPVKVEAPKVESVKTEPVVVATPLQDNTPPAVEAKPAVASVASVQPKAELSLIETADASPARSKFGRIPGGVSEEDGVTSLTCDLPLAAHLIDEALRNQMPLSEVVRKVIDLPARRQDHILIPFTLDDEEIANLAARYSLAPDDADGVKRAIIKELKRFAGEKV